MRKILMCEICGHGRILHDADGCRYPSAPLKETGSVVKKCGCKFYVKAADSRWHPRVRRRGWTGGVHF